MSGPKRAPSTPAEALAFLDTFSPGLVRLGLGPIEGALAAVGNPQRRYPALHVAGTNGKGSTCAFATAVLRAAGYRVGLYTSPHLVRFNERIQVDGQEISDALLGRRILEVVERYPALLDSPAPLTYFEVGTLVALHHFAEERVDVAVLETGLGGRLDATNAGCTAVSAITPISFDHQAVLGHTLSAIASEKAGILKAGAPAVSSSQPPEALEVLERVAAEKGVSLWLEGREFSLRGTGSGFSYRGPGLSFDGSTLGLRGAHQLQNAAVAVASLERLASSPIRLEAAPKVSLKVSLEALRAGLAGARWPGRLEEWGSAPTILLDGAHNRAGVQALLAGLDQLYAGRRIHLVFGVLGDKDYREMAEALLPRCASVHFTWLPSPRAVAPERLLAEVGAVCPVAEAHPSVSAAVQAACGGASPADVVLCAGSLVLVGEVRRQLVASGSTSPVGEWPTGR